MAYATTDQLKSTLSITGTEQDGYLADLLRRATTAIETYLGRKYSAGETTVADELYERQARVFWLRNVGITEITSLSVRDLRTDDWTVLTTDTYEWTSYGRVELDTASTFIKITYKYSSGGVPADVEAACLAMAAAVYQDGGEHGGISQERIGDLNISYDGRSSNNKVSQALSSISAYRVRHV